MAETKYHSKNFYACKSCWKDLGRTKKWLVEKFKKIKHSQTMCLLCQICNNGIYSFSDIEIFDSKIEHDRGLELKMLEKAGEIADLKHHKVFKLIPELFLSRYHFFNNIKNSSSCDIYSSENQAINIPTKDTWLFIVAENNKDCPALFKTHNAISYESDFTYILKQKRESGHIQNVLEKIIEEVKGLGKKEITETFKDAKTGEKIKRKIKIDFPLFTKEQPLSHFRKICQSMLAFYNQKVQVRASGQLWMFNRKWELERVWKS